MAGTAALGRPFLYHPVMMGALQYWQLGNDRLKARDATGAAQAFREALAVAPGHVPSQLSLSRLESSSGSYRYARSLALEACRARPSDPRTLLELVGLLRLFNEGEAVQQCLTRLPPLARVEIPVLLGFAAQLSNLNQQESALRFLDEARRGDPGYPPTIVARAQVLAYLGRFDEARAELERCLRLAPDIAQAYWLLSRLRRWSAADNHIKAMQSLLGSAVARNAESASMLGFALHKELDDIGDHAGAWQALEAACHSRRSMLRYRAEDSRALVDALMQWRPRGTRNASQGSHLDGPVPVFIVGMHRSGTTLLEQMLCGNDDVLGLGELYDFTAQLRLHADHRCRGVLDLPLVHRLGDVDLGAVGEGYTRGLGWRLGAKRCFTDKLPSNFLNVGFICEALPQARILHMVRDPMETCFSNLRELFGDANAYSYDQVELADYYLQYRRLMAHWHARFPGRILDVDYAALVREPGTTMRAVAAFCGVAFEAGMLDPGARARGVATASAVQVRERIAPQERPKWAPYEPWLGPLLSRLPQ